MTRPAKDDPMLTHDERLGLHDTQAANVLLGQVRGAIADCKVFPTIPKGAVTCEAHATLQESVEKIQAGTLVLLQCREAQIKNDIMLVQEAARRERQNDEARERGHGVVETASGEVITVKVSKKMIAGIAGMIATGVYILLDLASKLAEYWHKTN